MIVKWKYLKVGDKVRHPSSVRGPWATVVAADWPNKKLVVRYPDEDFDRELENRAGHVWMARLDKGEVA